MKSVFYGRDCQLLPELLAFYTRPAGMVVDVTANTRRMWSGIDTDALGVVFCDIDPSVQPDIVCDFANTGLPSGMVSLIVFDPPHLPSAAGSPKSLHQFVRNNGLNNTVDGDNITSVFPGFLHEAARILMDGGLVFAKLSDYVHNHRYQWMLPEFITAVRDAGLMPCDLIVKVDLSAGNLKSGRWVNSYHARRSHCWWIVVRKGDCEPRVGDVRMLQEGHVLMSMQHKCSECLYWHNIDDPDESCAGSFASDPDDKACDFFEPVKGATT